mmetsp:Transcript_7436/g.10461  ORF Transcript_7436/g.10461 Transcript_7436/m.10461 type:complete len:82 (-) Transcript_7436:469-714(-)
MNACDPITDDTHKTLRNSLKPVVVMIMMSLLLLLPERNSCNRAGKIVDPIKQIMKDETRTYKRQLGAQYRKRFNIVVKIRA